MRGKLERFLCGSSQVAADAVDMEVDDGGLAFFISDGGGRDAETTFYTMTAFYDVISESLVYWDGAEHHATITDKPEETEPETMEPDETLPDS